MRRRDLVALILWTLIPLAVAAYLLYEWLFGNAELTWVTVGVAVAAYCLIRLVSRVVQYLILRSAGFRTE